jgi:hypothetical protein
MPAPAHFGAYLSPIHELPFQEEQETFSTFNQEAMEPLTFLPEVDAVPLMLPTSLSSSLKHPASPFQATPSAEDLYILSGIPSSEEEFITTRLGSKNWSEKLKNLLWSIGTSALATVSGAATGAETHRSSHSTAAAAALEQWPSSDLLDALNNNNNNNDDDDFEIVKEDDEDNLVVGFPFSLNNSFTFGSAEPPEPLLWD